MRTPGISATTGAESFFLLTFWGNFIGYLTPFANLYNPFFIVPMFFPARRMIVGLTPPPTTTKSEAASITWLFADFPQIFANNGTKELITTRVFIPTLLTGFNLTLRAVLSISSFCKKLLFTSITNPGSKFAMSFHPNGMKSFVFSVAQHHQITKRIVDLISVYVVNNLIFGQNASKKFTHHIPVFSNIAFTIGKLVSWFENLSISMTIISNSTIPSIRPTTLNKLTFLISIHDIDYKTLSPIKQTQCIRQALALSLPSVTKRLKYR